MKQCPLQGFMMLPLVVEPQLVILKLSPSPHLTNLTMTQFKLGLLIFSTFQYTVDLSSFVSRSNLL